MKQVRIQVPDSGVTLADVTAKVFKRKETADVLGTYPTKSTTLHLIGYKKGKAGSENKHELPPPLDEKLFFGDILILASTSEDSFAKPISFKAEEYETFYKKMFGDFEDLDEEEGEEEEEEESEEVDEIEGAVAEEEEELPEVFEEEEEEPAPRKPRKRKADTTLAGLQTAKYDPKDRLSTEEYSSTAPTHPARINILNVIKKLFESEPHRLTAQQQMDIERAIFNGSVRMAEKKNIPMYWNDTVFMLLYMSRVRQIIGNLSPSSYIKNDELFESIKRGVSISELETMNSYEIFPSKWKAAFEFQQIVEKRQLEGNKSMATDKFTCGRCWKKECTYYEMQTRSADEPMTIFISCLNCGKHWRQ
jgi:DNA-directed RNA polymerase subunit M/transcription elongation factor TFIIS